MKRYIIPTAAFVICLMIGGSVLSTSAIADQDDIYMEVSDNKLPTSSTTFDFNARCAYWLKHGYSNMKEYKEALTEMQEEVAGSAEQAVSLYSFSLTDEEKENLYLYEEKMLKATHIELFDKYKELFDEIIANCEPQSSATKEVSTTVQAPEYAGASGGLTMSQGVNYFNGRTETWYSSNILYHYMTPQWTADANGVYRDSDGYVVVAASDLAYGTLVNTSHGMGKVYDCGCAPGVTDIYVNW